MRTTHTGFQCKAALLAALLLISHISSIMAVTDKSGNPQKVESAFMNPDFAFPENVEKDSYPVLEKAIRDKDGVTAIKAAIQVCVSRNLISRSSFSENVAMLDSAAREFQAPFSSLFYLLEGTMYSQLYQMSPWIYNNRTLPLDVFPEDTNTWSGELFARKILELVDKATADPSMAMEMSLKYIESVLTDTEFAVKSGLSVYDFIIYRSVDLLRGVGGRGLFKPIPFKTDSRSMILSFSEECHARAESLLDSVLKYREGAGSVPALVVAVREKSATLDNAEKISFLRKWMDKLDGYPENSVLLDSYYNAIDRYDFIGTQDSRILYSRMKEWLRRFPDGFGKRVIEYDVARMAMKSGRLSVRNYQISGEPTKGNMNLTNMNSGYVLVYKVSEKIVNDGSVNIGKFPAGARKVAAIPVRAEGEIPFACKCEFEVPALPAGYYVLIPSETPSLSKGWRNKVELWSVQTYHVTDLSIISVNNSSQKNSGVVYVVDAGNQSPVAGAKVLVYGNNGNKVIKSGFTDEQGAFSVPEGSHMIKARKGDSMARTWSGYNYYKADDDAQACAEILTDLSIYRPGDKVRFSVVGWTRHKGDNALLKKERLKVTLRDANYNVVDTLALSTDASGRCNGEFSLPLSGLSGTYSLNAEFQSFTGKNAGLSRFQVADYKAPGFVVELEADSTQNYKIGDVLRFKGEVKTYTGMPLGNAVISFNITWSPWWKIWSGSNPNASYGGDLKADESGKFVIELPTDNLRGTEFELGIYTLVVSATSESGETRNAPELRFSLGSGYTVNPEVAESVRVTGDSVRFHVPVRDMLGLPSVQKVDYRIVDESGSDVVSDGSFNSPALTIPSGKLPSGRYVFTFNIAGDTVKYETRSAVWRSSDSKAPYPTPLWIPEKEIVAQDSVSAVEIKVGSGYPGSSILCVVTDDSGIVRREWLSVNDENIKVRIDAPGRDRKIWVTFSGMHDFSRKVETVSVVHESLKEKLSVKTESFRNKLTAGEVEKWRFTFSVKGKRIPSLPAFAVMSDKALNALSPFSWTFTPGRGYHGNATGVSSFVVGNIMTSGIFSKALKVSAFSDPIPSWQTYSYGLADSGRISRGVRTTSRMIKGVMAKTESVSDGVDDMALEEEPQVMYASQSLKMATATENLAALDQEVAGEGGLSSYEEKGNLRPVEMPLAFFMPDLLSDGDGNVSVEFEVPDFNTTWQFQILGYSENLLTAWLKLDAIASKPVMVRSNPPRFLRTGDKAKVTALLFNNSDTDINLGGRIEIVNPVSGESIAAGILEDAPVSPSANRLVSVEFDVPSNTSSLIMKAYAEGKNHSDGEQTLIDVLPSSTPVVESTRFYIGAGNGTFSQKLPKFNKDANVTLRYCDNPVWECVLALPSISNPGSDNVLSLMRSLYANSMSIGIVGKYPQIRKGLEELFAKKDSASSVLKSNLEKDAVLKTVELGNTPWVNNASAETARMGNLNTLLDKSAAEAAVGTLMEKVRRLQNPDGGWSWCKDMRSSLFMTEQSLRLFGMMNNFGYLPSGADKMINRAIAYCDKEIYDNYIKSERRFSNSEMLSYLFVRSCFNVGSGSAGFSSMANDALKEISEDWEHYSVYDKSMAAILFSRSKGYERMAGVILESLNQFASKSETKGWWFDNLSSGFNGWSKLSATSMALQAYAEIEPGSTAVDGLRQWLVLQKETEDWGADPSAVEVIQSILASGADWIGTSVPPEITLGGRPLEIADSEMLTGVITLSLDAKKASGKVVKIGKKSESPSWGGVISQFVAPINEVKMENCGNLKIEKRLFVVKDTPSGEVVTEGGIKVGDKVRVTLTVTCDKDMNYVALIDERGACLEPDDQISRYCFVDGIGAYREVRDSRTSFFIEFLPKGVNVISYDCHADREGGYAVGIASVQSLYSPLQTAHSAGAVLTVKAK